MIRRLISFLRSYAQVVNGPNAVLRYASVITQLTSVELLQTYSSTIAHFTYYPWEGVSKEELRLPLQQMYYCVQCDKPALIVDSNLASSLTDMLIWLP